MDECECNCECCERIKAENESLLDELDEKVWRIEVKSESGELVCDLDLDWGEHAVLLGLGMERLFRDLLEEASGVQVPSLRDEAEDEVQGHTGSATV